MDNKSEESSKNEQSKEQEKVPFCYDKDVKKTADRYLFDRTEYWFAMSVAVGKEVFVRDYLMNRKHYDRGIPNKDFENKAFMSIVQKVNRDPVSIVLSFVASQFVHKKYSDRQVWREKVLIPGVVFVKIKNCDRVEKIFGQSKISNFVNYFYVDKNTHRPEPIPEVQMETLISFIENNVEMVDFEGDQKSGPQPPQDLENYVAGKKVKIVSGPCKGLDGVLTAVRIKNEYAKGPDGKVLTDIGGEPKIEKKVVFELELNSSFCQRFQVLQSQVELLD